MKILYGEGDFLESRHQLIAYPATVGAERKKALEKEINKRHPDVRTSVEKMFAENEHFEVVPPRLGDVIWTQTSGNKWIAHMIVFDEMGHLREDALDVCMRSVRKKANELGQSQIGIPLRWYPDREMSAKWVRTYEVIEDVMSDENDQEVLGTFQVFAYDPDSEFVRDVFESLPGGKRAFYSEPVIRFRSF